MSGKIKIKPSGGECAI